MEVSGRCSPEERRRRQRCGLKVSPVTALLGVYHSELVKADQK